MPRSWTADVQAQMESLAPHFTPSWCHRVHKCLQECLRCFPELGGPPQLAEMVSGRLGGEQGRQMCLLPPALEAVTQAVSCLSQPPGGVPGTQPLLPNSMDPTRQQGRESRQRGGPGGWWGGPLRSLLTACGSSIVLHRSPQHGRVNAENEPSPRHGAHGAWPTGNQLPVCLSICLPCHLCAPAFSPFSTVCRSPTVLALS